MYYWIRNNIYQQNVYCYEGEGVHTSQCTQTSQLTLESRLLRLIILSQINSFEAKICGMYLVFLLSKYCCKPHKIAWVFDVKYVCSHRFHPGNFRDGVPYWHGSKFCLPMAQTQLQKSSYWPLLFCGDLLIYEINYWVFHF